MKKEINDLLLKMQSGENCIGETANKILDLFDDIGALYPTDEQISEMVEDFAKDLNVSSTTKRATQFGFQEGMFKMLEICKKSNQ